MPDLANTSVLQPLTHLLKTRKRTPIVGHEQVQARVGKGLLHRLALPEVQRHGLFDTAMLAGRCHHEAVGVVAVRGRGDIHRIHFGVGNQCLSVGVHPLDAMARGIIAHRVMPAPHHRHQRRTRRLVECRATLALGDAAAADHCPAHHPHKPLPAPMPSA
ncbi:hypothetical protein D3C73_1243380 [compost metagenome]